MALVDEVQTRLSADTLLQLTNPNDPDASATATARLNAACADAQAEFEVITGVSFDDSIARHIAYAVPGAMIYLEDYMGMAAESLDKRLSTWRERLKQLALTTGRRAITPLTTSNLTPSTEPAARPVADRARLYDFIPNAPTTLNANSAND